MELRPVETGEERAGVAEDRNATAGSRVDVSAPPKPEVAPKPRRRDRSDMAARLRRKVRPRLPLSLLTLRILGVNVLALAILVGGLMYLDVYRQSLIDSRIKALMTHAEVVAAALGESAVRGTPPDANQIDVDVARNMLRRLVRPTGHRARLFDASGALVADSRRLVGLRNSVVIEELPPPRSGGVVGNVLVDLYDRIVGLFKTKEEFPRYVEHAKEHAADYAEVANALEGEKGSAVRVDSRGLLVVSVAVPVQRYRKIAGALMMSSANGEIEQSLREVRLQSLQVFAVALAITFLMSLYLARAIGRPIKRLAAAADRVRRGRNRETQIPDFTRRQDEIGDLSGSLREMTDALWRRMDAIENFAADVAHEIKNPLSSLRSAVETAAHVKDPDRQRQLMSIILEDVQRLDRLISDISYASRLDSQLSRNEWTEIDLESLLATLVAVHEATIDEENMSKARRLRLEVPPSTGFPVRGSEDQLVQVFQNIINNGLSFAPKGSAIVIRLHREGPDVEVTIDDEGPGIPDADLESIFGRFYSARPAEEKFGTHSGLGLSISRQILEAHGGTIRAENRRDEKGNVLGARFVVHLPAGRKTVK